MSTLGRFRRTGVMKKNLRFVGKIDLNKKLISVAIILLMVTVVMVGWVSHTLDDQGKTITNASEGEARASEQPKPQGDYGSGWIRDVDATWDYFNALNGTWDYDDEFFPDFATNSTGTIFAVFQQYDDEEGDNGIMLTYSSDGGVSWRGHFIHGVSYSYTVADDPKINETSPSIAIDPWSDRIYVAYEYWDSSKLSSIHVASALPSGLTTWNDTVVLQSYCPPMGFCSWANNPSIAVESRSSDAYVYVAYEHHSDLPKAEGIYVNGSTDQGVTWQSIHSIPALGYYLQPHLVINYGPRGVNDKRAYLTYVYGLNSTSMYEVRFESANGTSGSLINGGLSTVWPVRRVVYNATLRRITPAWPVIASTYGAETAVIAWEYNQGVTTGMDIGYATTSDGGNTWFYQVDLHSALGDEYRPQVATDGEGSTNPSVLGLYHITYLRDTPTGKAIVYQTRPYDFSLPWSRPVLISDSVALPSVKPIGLGLTTQVRPDGNWYPLAGWADFRDKECNIYVTTPGGNVSVGTFPDGLWFGIDGVAYNTRQLKSVAAGYSVYLNTTFYQYAGPGTRFAFLFWDDGGAQNHSFWMRPSEVSVTATFGAEYQVTIDTVPPTLEVQINGTPYQAPRSFWWPGGSEQSLNATSPQYSGSDTRYFWTRWSDSGAQDHTILVTGPETITAYFSTQYRIIISAHDGGGPLLGINVSIDGSFAGVTNYTGWLYSGSAHEFGVETPVNIGGTDYMFMDWDSGPTANPLNLTVSGPFNLSAHYQEMTEEPYFTVSVSPPSQQISPGQTTTYVVNVTSFNNYAGTVQLNLSGLPAPAQGTFDPASVVLTAGSSKLSTLTINNTLALADGTYSLEIMGTDGVMARSDYADLVVLTAPFFGVSATPLSVQILTGEKANYTITIQSFHNYTGNVTLNITGLPGSATAVFNPPYANLSAGSSETSNLTIGNTATVSDGTYTLTIVGNDSVLQDSCEVSLIVVGKGTINGTVVDQDNQPLSDATVELLSDSTVVDSTSTDSNGKFNFIEDAGQYTVRASMGGYQEDSEMVILAAGGEETVALKLYKILGSVTGRVRDEKTHEFIEGATVEVFDKNGNLLGSDTSNATGAFSIKELPLGTFDVRFTADGYKTKTLIDLHATETDNETDLGTVDLTPIPAPSVFGALASFWWIILIIIVIVVILLVLLAKRKKPREDLAGPEKPAEEERPPAESGAAERRTGEGPPPEGSGLAPPPNEE